MTRVSCLMTESREWCLCRHSELLKSLGNSTEHAWATESLWTVNRTGLLVTSFARQWTSGRCLHGLLRHERHHSLYPRISLAVFGFESRPRKSLCTCKVICTETKIIRSLVWIALLYHENGFLRNIIRCEWMLLTIYLRFSFHWWNALLSFKKKKKRIISGFWRLVNRIGSPQDELRRKRMLLGVERTVQGVF